MDSNGQKKAYIVVIILMALIMAAAVLYNLPIYRISLIGAAAFTMFFIFPQIMIAIFLVIRSSLDVFTEVGIRIGPMALNVPSITSLFFLIGGTLYILYRYSIGKDVVLDRIGRTFIFLLASLFPWAILAYVNFGGSGLTGIREWIRLSSLFMIYVLVRDLAISVGYKRIMNYILLALPIPVVVGIYQVITSTGIKVFGINRICGTLAHPNYFSLFLTLYIGIILWKIRFAKLRIFWMASLAVIVFLLISTFSIGGFIMFIVMSMILAFKTLKRKSRFIIFVTVFLAIIAFSAMPAGKARINREILNFGSVMNMMGKGVVTDQNSVSWRLMNWRLLMKEFEKRPVLGHGLHTTAEIVSPLKTEAHNDYLRFLVETGYLGLALFLYFLFVLGQEIVKAMRSDTAIRDTQFSYLALVSFSVYIAWLIGSIADNYITATAFQYYFWALLGAVTGESRRSA